MIQGIQPAKTAATSSVVGVVVLALLFSVQAFAGSVDELYRPAQVPENFVVTPFGYFHPSCTREIREGETLLADGRVEHADRSIDASTPVCSYPHYTRSGVAIAPNATRMSGPNFQVINGWLEYISVTSSTSYGKIVAKWSVPPAPPSDDGQTLFFFPGFEDTSDIISIVQPVLQFGPSSAGGAKYWAIASWNCCISGIADYSSLVKVNSGDTIVGTITSTCKAGQTDCATWNVISEDTTNGKKTTLAKTPADNQVWNWAFGAVIEVYDVDQCNDFPADTSVVFTTKLYDQNRKLIASPAWTPSPAGSGTKPWCNFGVNVTPTKETLEY